MEIERCVVVGSTNHTKQPPHKGTLSYRRLLMALQPPTSINCQLENLRISIRKKLWLWDTFPPSLRNTNGLARREPWWNHLKQCKDKEEGGVNLLFRLSPITLILLPIGFCAVCIIIWHQHKIWNGQWWLAQNLWLKLHQDSGDDIDNDGHDGLDGHDGDDDDADCAVQPKAVTVIPTPCLGSTFSYLG